MMNTAEGKKKMRDELYKAFRAVCPEGQMTCGYDDMMKMQDYFAPMHDRIAGGHWIWDKVASKAAFNFQAKKFGTGGRLSFPQWMSAIMIFGDEINPFINPKELTREQIR